MRLRIPTARRRGVASIELAFATMMFVVPLILGIWEVGRFIHVQQVVANGAREGARLAAQGFTIKPDGSAVAIVKEAPESDPKAINVKDVVCDYLRAAGLTTLQPSDITVTFQFTAARLTDPGKGTTPTEPYLGEKGEPFTVTVSVPWAKVRWVNLGMLQPTDVHFTVSWRMMIDEAFSINETLPSW